MFLLKIKLISLYFISKVSFLLQQNDKPSVRAWLTTWWPGSSVRFPSTFCETIPSCRWRRQAQAQRVGCWWPGQWFSAERRRKWLDKNQFSPTSLQEAVEKPHVKGGEVMDFLKENGRCIDDLWYLILSTVKSERLRNHLQSLCDLLDCWVRDEVTCVSGKRCSWAPGEALGELGRWQRSRAVAGLWYMGYKMGAGALGTCEGLQLWSLHSPRIDTRWLSSTNLIQITLWTRDCFYQIRYSTWCELVPVSLRLLKDRQ